jgi:hypothetical protein
LGNKQLLSHVGQDHPILEDRLSECLHGGRILCIQPDPVTALLARREFSLYHPCHNAIVNLRRCLANQCVLFIYFIDLQ